jgi:hypothetical protein
MKVIFTKKTPDAVIPEQLLPGVYLIKAAEVKQVALQDHTLGVAYLSNVEVEVEGGIARFSPVASQLATSHILFNNEIFTKNEITPIFKLFSAANVPNFYAKDDAVAYLIVNELANEPNEVVVNEYVEPEQPAEEDVERRNKPVHSAPVDDPSGASTDTCLGSDLSEQPVSEE